VIRIAALVLWKDLVVEWRTREILATMMFFAIMVVLIFSFAFLAEGRAGGDAVAGILWTAIAFAGTLGLGRAADREREGDAWRALLLSPAPRAALFLGKLLGIVVLMAIIEVAVLLLSGLLFGARLGAHLGLVAGLFGFGTIGYAEVGALFSLMLGRARSREVLLAVVLYPIIVPVIIAGSKGTSALLEVVPDVAAAGYWVRFLGVFDLIFLVIALWAFEPLMVERA
jgi:ABC-type transport system involved in cytochrome c biogenesis permease component